MNDICWKKITSSGKNWATRSGEFLPYVINFLFQIDLLSSREI